MELEIWKIVGSVFGSAFLISACYYFFWQYGIFPILDGFNDLYYYLKKRIVKR